MYGIPMVGPTTCGYFEDNDSIDGNLNEANPPGTL